MNCILLDNRKFHFPVPASLLELAIKKIKPAGTDALFS